MAVDEESSSFRFRIQFASKELVGCGIYLLFVTYCETRVNENKNFIINFVILLFLVTVLC